MSTGLPGVTIADDHASLAARLGAYVELTKPRIVLMEVLAVVATLHVATGYGAPGSPWSVALALSVAVGAMLVGGSANALNQWIEQERDERMIRTRIRPLPSGRLTPAEALAFGLLTLAMGVATLLLFAGPAPAILAVATWIVYLAIYTPLKSRSWTNTAVGAVSGAAPLWIGWTAGGGRIDDPLALSLVGVMYVWQFPHFMSIAWLLKDDYVLGGYRMSTTCDPSGRWAGWQAVVGSAVLIPISLAPVVVSTRVATLAYATPVFLAGMMLLAASAAFLARRDDISARRLLRASLLYVPVWLLALWCSGA